MPHASVLDIKIGTTSITVNTPIDKHDLIKAKDAKTTSVELGMRITAMLTKDRNGQLQEKVRKPHDHATAAHIPEFILKVLKSNDSEEINLEALEFFKV